MKKNTFILTVIAFCLTLFNLSRAQEHIVDPKVEILDDGIVTWRHVQITIQR